MKLTLTLGVVLGLIGTAEMAQARSLYLYGAVPVAADPRLVIAYDNARAWCSLYANGSIGAVRVHAGAYGSPAMRACLSRKGFVYQSGEAYAYPLRMIAFVTKG